MTDYEVHEKSKGNKEKCFLKIGREISVREGAEIRLIITADLRGIHYY